MVRTTLNGWDHITYALSRSLTDTSSPLARLYLSTSVRLLSCISLAYTHAVLSIDAIFQDPEMFEDPHLFNPDRYMKSEFGTKPGVDTTGFRDDLGFGFGRVSSFRIPFLRD